MQSQIQALVKCDVSTIFIKTFASSMEFADGVQLLSSDVENEITLTAFRLLTMDLLALFNVMNEGTINVLGETWTWTRLSRPLTIRA